MSARTKHDAAAPLARRDFARRLRELRLPRGFRTARSLARSLDIDENRYTRYERAEVEPDLGMIRRICEILGVTPNELLGVGPRPMTHDEPMGATRPSSRAAARRRGADAADGTKPLGLQAAAWLLAEAAIAVKVRHKHNGGLPPSDTAPLAAMKETGQLFKLLMEQPFETITMLLSDAAIAEADAAAVATVRERIDRLVVLLQHD